MSLFVDGFSRVSSKESKEDILVGVMDIANLMIHVEQVEEENLRDKEEFKNKRAKTLENEFKKQKNNVNQFCFKQK